MSLLDLIRWFSTQTHSRLWSICRGDVLRQLANRCLKQMSVERLWQCATFKRFAVVGNHWPLASQYCCWHWYSFLKTFFSRCRCHSVALVLVGGGAEAVNVRTNATYTQPRVRSFAAVIAAFGWPTPTGVCSTALRPPITPCPTRVMGGNIVREAFPVNLTARDIILIRAPKKYALSPTTNGNVNIVNKAIKKNTYIYKPWFWHYYYYHHRPAALGHQTPSGALPCHQGHGAYHTQTT